MKCTALGRSAFATCLGESKRVIGYFGTGRKGLNNHAGCVYFMEDRVLIATPQTSEMVKVKRPEISL